MSEKRFTNVSIGMEEAYCDFSIIKVGDKIISDGIPTTDAIGICDLLNGLHEENMNLRAKHTQMIIIMKDVVNDLKRIDTYRYAEHLEKIANLHFLSEKESDDE